VEVGGEGDRAQKRRRHTGSSCPSFFFFFWSFSSVSRDPSSTSQKRQRLRLRENEDGQAATASECSSRPVVGSHQRRAKLDNVMYRARVLDPPLPARSLDHCNVEPGRRRFGRPGRRHGTKRSSSFEASGIRATRSLALSGKEPTRGEVRNTPRSCGVNPFEDAAVRGGDGQGHLTLGPQGPAPGTATIPRCPGPAAQLPPLLTVAVCGG